MKSGSSRNVGKKEIVAREESGNLSLLNMFTDADDEKRDFGRSCGYRGLSFSWLTACGVRVGEESERSGKRISRSW